MAFAMADKLTVFVDGSVNVPIRAVPKIRLLRRTLTVKQWSMGDAEPSTPIAAYEDCDGYIRVPRVYGLQLIANLGLDYEDCRSEGADRVYRKEVSHEGDYAYQKPFVDKMLSAAIKYGDFLVEAATGKGKSEMALSMIQKLGKTAVIVVDQDNLMQQWIDRAKTSLGLTDSQIGIVRGDRCDYEGKHIVVAMMQSLSQRWYEVPFYDWAGVVVFDEVHTVGAPTFSRVLHQFSARIRVGISATVDRGDSLQKLIHWGLGEVRARLTDKHDKSYVYYLTSDTVYSWYATISPKTGRVIEEVAEDAKRNLMLAKAIVWLYESGRDTLVVSDRISQIEGLRSLCHSLGMPEEDTGLYSGFRTVYGYQKDPTPSEEPYGLERGADYTPVMFTSYRKKIPVTELNEVKRNAKVMFSTYGMMQKGVDVPRLSAGIDCTHRSKAQQVHGRILRKLDGKLVPVWVTVRDINCYRLEHQWVNRIDDYVSSSADIYQFDLLKGVRPVDIVSLKRSVHANIRELKNLGIRKRVDGHYVLVNGDDQ